MIKNLNPACLDLGYSEEQSCVIYLSILCKEHNGCKDIQIELEYENSRPKKIAMGTQKHGALTVGESNYYYVTISPNSNVEEINAVLQPLNGDVQLFASMIQGNIDPNEWNLPELDFSSEWEWNSNEVLKSKVISINVQEIQECFKIEETGKETECVIVYGIYSTNKQQGTEVKYNFIVYKNLVVVQDNIPVTGKVAEG